LVIIQPTLTLSADQGSKLNLPPQHLRATVYNIDMYKTPQDMDSIVYNLRLLKGVSPASLPRYFFNRFAEVYLVWAMKSRKAALKNIDTHFVEFLGMLQLIAAGLIIWQV
jgi:hypothetical protein